METADRLLHEITFVGFEWVELMIVGELKIQNFEQFINHCCFFNYKYTSICYYMLIEKRVDKIQPSAYSKM